MTKDIFHPSHGVAERGQAEDGFFNSKSTKRYRSSYSLPDPYQHKSSYNLLSQWDPGDKLLQPPLFWKETTSELTAKTKGSDRILTTRLEGYRKKFCGLFGQKAHKTQQFTQFYSKIGGLP